MKTDRYLLTDLVLCLPLLAVLALFAFAGFKILPRFETLEAERVENSYRELAAEIGHGEVRSKTRSANGLKSRGRLSRGTWGYEEAGEGVFVWYRAPRATLVKGVAAARVERRDLAAWLKWSLIGITLLTLLVTNFGLRRFRRLVRVRDEFVAATAHDLRAPLHALQMLTYGREDALQRVVRRMQAMIENLAVFAQAGGRRPRPQSETIDLVALCREAYAGYREDFEADFQPVAFDESEIPQGELTANGDANLVLQIFWNLFGNELKYAAEHGPITVRFRRTEKCAVVQFLDSGPGMSARDRRRIFRRYYRVRTLDQSSKGGFGLGLCVSREFARSMRGDLLAAANLPKGTVFTLKLPRPAAVSG